MDNQRMSMTTVAQKRSKDNHDSFQGHWQHSWHKDPITVGSWWMNAGAKAELHGFYDRNKQQSEKSLS